MPGATQHVAVVGAGLSGLMFARQALKDGHRVTMFERSWRVGGRTCGHYKGRRGTAEDAATPREDPVADMGAQYFTIRDPACEAILRAWEKSGVVAPWPDRASRLGQVFVRGNTSGSRRSTKLGVFPLKNQDDRRPKRYVGVPSMEELCRTLLRDSNEHSKFAIQYQTTVTDLLKDDMSVRLVIAENTTHSSSPPRDAQSQSLFDWVVLAMPAPQAAPLLRHSSPILFSRASAVPFHSCWALVVTLDLEKGHPLASLPYDGLFVNPVASGGTIPGSLSVPTGGEDASPVLGWVCRNTSKHGRGKDLAHSTWVAHTTPGWADAHIDSSHSVVLPHLMAAFKETLGVALNQDTDVFAENQVVSSHVHRWRHAIPDPIGEPHLIDEANRIALCGDWCGGPRVEGAMLSGMRLATKWASL
eukprot:TRINITY_DN4370_c0_g1_i1.p1 TRINITY_DN4370_c0_g1~~TRINITY_DN4370_c0_g1_i1.p1  ORF type:complete len:416 (-),score=27.14 TRINITY_DN4370_c0_g1_i1:118-1365(-)